MDSDFATVAVASPLQVILSSGVTVPGLPVMGLSYSAGQRCLALFKGSNVPVILPLGV